jgi:hypothetical protein
MPAIAAALATGALGEQPKIEPVSTARARIENVSQITFSIRPSG